jgi:hypothetical protein
MKMCAALRRFWNEDFGAVAAEFGLVISALIVILTGCFEASRYILLNQKLDRASSSVADLMAQADGITVSILNDIYTAAGEQTLPFDLDDDGRVIVSSIYRVDANPAKVQWQCAGGGDYSAASSAIGGEGDDAILPPNFDVGVGANVVAAEVFYDYQPFLFQGIFEPTVFRHTSYTRPRGALLTTDPGC